MLALPLELTETLLHPRGLPLTLPASRCPLWMAKSVSLSEGFGSFHTDMLDDQLNFEKDESME